MLKWLLSFFGFKSKKVEVEKERLEPVVPYDFATARHIRDAANRRDEPLPEHEFKTYKMPQPSRPVQRPTVRPVETKRTSAARPNPSSRPSSGTTPSRVHDDNFYLNQALLHSSVIDDTPSRRNDVCEPTRSHDSPSRNDSYDSPSSYDSPTSPCD